MAKNKIELTEKLIEELCDALDFPLTLDDACAFVGVPARTVKGWLGAAEMDDPNALCALLAKRVAKVMATGQRGELRSLAIMQAASSPAMTQFLLERLVPSMALKREMKLEATVTPVAPIDLSKLTDEQLRIVQQAEEIKALVSGEGGE